MLGMINFISTKCVVLVSTCCRTLSLPDRHDRQRSYLALEPHYAGMFQYFRYKTSDGYFATLWIQWIKLYHLCSVDIPLLLWAMQIVSLVLLSMIVLIRFHENAIVFDYRWSFVANIKHHSLMFPNNSPRSLGLILILTCWTARWLLVSMAYTVMPLSSSRFGKNCIFCFQLLSGLE